MRDYTLPIFYDIQIQDESTSHLVWPTDCLHGKKTE